MTRFNEDKKGNANLIKPSPTDHQFESAKFKKKVPKYFDWVVLGAEMKALTKH